MTKCKITGHMCPAWSDFDGCGLVGCKYKKDGAVDMNVGHAIHVNDLYDEDGGDIG